MQVNKISWIRNLKDKYRIGGMTPKIQELNEKFLYMDKTIY